MSDIIANILSLQIAATEATMQRLENLVAIITQDSPEAT